MDGCSLFVVKKSVLQCRKIRRGPLDISKWVYFSILVIGSIWPFVNTFLPLGVDETSTLDFPRIHGVKKLTLRCLAFT